MSYTAIGRKKVYASIEDLPENQKLVNGDRLILQTEDGTALVDYENVKIDLQHTTFGDQIRDLVSLSSAIDSYIEQLHGEYKDINVWLSGLEKFTGYSSDGTVTNTESLSDRLSTSEQTLSTLNSYVGSRTNSSNLTLSTQIDLLDTTVKSLDTTVKSLDTTVKSLDTTVKSDVSNLKTIVDTLQNSIVYIYAILGKEQPEITQNEYANYKQNVDDLLKDMTNVKKSIETINETLDTLKTENSDS